MATYRTAMGKVIDMTALAAKNERTRAVGNMKVNSRGDTIDPHGRIITPATAKVNSAYANTVGNKSAQSQKKAYPAPDQPAPKNALRQLPPAEDLTEVERELDESFSEDLEIEAIKAAEVAQQSKKTGKK